MTVSVSSEAFVKLPRDLLESEAWRSLSVNAWRLLNFLMIEHMKHGGKGNGRLLAPRRQLEMFGIGARHVSGAIEECERAGLVDCVRGVGRHPNVYSLTWLPLVGGAPASNRWRASRSEDFEKPHRSDFPSEVHGCFPSEVTKAVATSHRKSQRPKTSTSERKHLSRKESYHRRGNSRVSGYRGEAEGRGKLVGLVGSGLAAEIAAPHPGKPEIRGDNKLIVEEAEVIGLASPGFIRDR